MHPATASAPFNVSVAPMEGVTTLPMRLWLHLTSQPLAMTTPFLRATQVFPIGALPRAYAPELLELRGLLPYELTPQILSADPEHFLRTADLLPPAVAPVIEINCGCPSPNSAGRHAGSGILRDPEVFGRTLERLSSALGPGRLAVKMRLGFAQPEELRDLLPHVASLPLARLTVHGRTRADGYRGAARWDAIGQVAATATAPTWASGDVVDLRSLARMRAAAPVATGAMIGRGILRNPWVFEELRSGLPVALARDVLLDALFCYVLLQELSISLPDKLFATVASGKVAKPCGTRAEAWAETSARLASLVFDAPFVLSATRAVPGGRISGTTFARLRYLWQHLRSSLPVAWNIPKLMKARSFPDFLSTWSEGDRGHPTEPELVRVQSGVPDLEA